MDIDLADEITRIKDTILQELGELPPDYKDDVVELLARVITTGSDQTAQVYGALPLFDYDPERRPQAENDLADKARELIVRLGRDLRQRADIEPYQKWKEAEAYYMLMRLRNALAPSPSDPVRPTGDFLDDWELQLLLETERKD